MISDFRGNHLTDTIPIHHTKRVEIMKQNNSSNQQFTAACSYELNSRKKCNPSGRRNCTWARRDIDLLNWRNRPFASWSAVRRNPRVKSVSFNRITNNQQSTVSRQYNGDLWARVFYFSKFTLGNKINISKKFNKIISNLLIFKFPVTYDNDLKKSKIFDKLQLLFKILK